MIAKYVYRGDVIDYTPDVDVAAGSVVVIGSIIGITKLDIKAGQLGALALVGVFDIVKATGEGTAVAKGAKVYWNATAKQITAVAAGNVYLGEAVAAAATGDAAARVRLGGPAIPAPGNPIASLTDNSGGTASNIIAVVSDVDGAADAIAANSAKINAIIAALVDYGVIRPAS